MYQRAVEAEKEIAAIARGEAQEMCSHVSSAHTRGCLSADERNDLRGRYTAIAKMLSSLARYLAKEDRTFRA